MKTPKNKKKNVRLPSDVIPLYYNITLKPDLESHTFSGEETITIDLKKEADSITLHSKDLDIVSVALDGIPAKKISYDDPKETATFSFAKKIGKGEAKLHIVFRGILANNMRGFYKSRYMVEGKERFMATTQFEATDARRCIPCFDEPSQKAVFDVHLVVPTDKTAVSNTLPVHIKEHEAGYKVVSFAPTPKMSTYLLAFIVGDFEWVEEKTKSGVLVRVLTVPGKSHQAKFALSVAVRSLEFYEKYFDIPYPLNTLDMLAIPDFSSGAMENWGAVTYRETALLVDESHSSSSTREWVAEVIAHELAHQWFGNLVTMEWWTHLWLNEGFASYIPYLALDEMFPEWTVWERFATDTLAIALRLDGLKNTHPIEVDVHDPNEIGEIFDAVSYSKGASVIRMLAEYLGEKDFRNGLRHYLKAHSYKNASTIHLWEAFEKVSKKPVKKIMATWTRKSGYPLVEARLSKDVLVLSQKRYFSSSTSAQKSKDTTVWPIPLSIVTSRGEKSLKLMETKRLSLSAPKGPWFKLNAREGSLYRVSYGPKLLSELSVPIREGRISSSDRLGIVRDMFSLAESGEMETPEVLEYLDNFKSETEYIVWVEIVSGLRKLGNILSETDSYELFRSYARNILSEIVERVGWDPKTGESHTDRLLRALILGAASHYGDENVILRARYLFEMRNREHIDPDLRGVVYGAVIREGGEKEYKTLVSMYKKEELHEEANRLLGALGATRDKKLIRVTLEFIMSKDVRMQDRNGAFASVLFNPFGKEIGWKFIKKNWKKIGEAYGNGNHLLSRLISVLNRNSTKEAYKDIKEFFKTHKAPAAERTIEQTLEYIDSNVKWLARDGKKVERWLREVYNSAV